MNIALLLNRRNQTESSPLKHTPLLLPKKKGSLPPLSSIQHHRKTKSMRLEDRRTIVLQQVMSSKEPVVGPPRLKSERWRTETTPQRQGRSSSRSGSFDEIRMRPIDKYWFKMENIRLAQRLLVMQPSPEVSRSSQKQFYNKQKHYRGQLSRNLNDLKRRKAKLNKAWVD